MLSTLCQLCIALLCLTNIVDTARAARGPQAKISHIPNFDWSALKPSSKLVWSECYTSPWPQPLPQKVVSAGSSKSRTFSCARLTLPLDYHNFTNHINVTVPIIKLSSTPSKLHRGTVFIAPGGAGNSRINDLTRLYHDTSFFDSIDLDFEYDFLTFDNRGFGYSEPTARCFEDVGDGLLWEQRMMDLGGVMRSHRADETSEVRLAAAKAKGALCLGKDRVDSGIRRHMTTAYAARDMLELLKQLPGRSVDLSGDKSAGHEFQKLKFIGLSYGTVLGQTFASLYPDFVDRMVLDAAVDASDWVAKWQTEHLTDTDAVWTSFSKDCFDVGASCPLWRTGDAGPSSINKRISEFLGALKQKPVYAVRNGNARLITYRDVRLAMCRATMVPAPGALWMATTLDALIRGHTNITINFPFESIPTTSTFYSINEPNTISNLNEDAGVALNCGDAEDITNATLSEFKSYLQALESQSHLAAFFQGERKIRCMGWPITPAWRFTGPFASADLKTPMLVLSNRLDPMTSLESARKVTKRFPGSKLVVQEARGHTTLGNVSPDPCMLQYLRTYLKDGELPAEEVVCGVDCNVFDGSCLPAEDFAALNMRVAVAHWSGI